MRETHGTQRDPGFGRVTTSPRGPRPGSALVISGSDIVHRHSRPSRSRTTAPEDQERTGNRTGGIATVAGSVSSRQRGHRHARDVNDLSADNREPPAGRPASRPSREGPKSRVKKATIESPGGPTIDSTDRNSKRGPGRTPQVQGTNRNWSNRCTNSKLYTDGP